MRCRSLYSAVLSVIVALMGTYAYAKDFLVHVPQVLRVYDRDALFVQLVMNSLIKQAGGDQEKQRALAFDARWIGQSDEETIKYVVGMSERDAAQLQLFATQPEALRKADPARYEEWSALHKAKKLDFIALVTCNNLPELQRAVGHAQARVADGAPLFMPSSYVASRLHKLLFDVGVFHQMWHIDNENLELPFANRELFQALPKNGDAGRAMLKHIEHECQIELSRTLAAVHRSS